MLEMRPGCECCDLDLAPDAPGAMICSFECTFCASCADRLSHRCSNCGGGLMPRPIRPAALLKKYPASTQRTVNPAACPDPTA
ncbi:MAG: DUF1272 domain-containing protein [Pseudomonadota bacterium]